MIAPLPEIMDTPAEGHLNHMEEIISWMRILGHSDLAQCIKKCCKMSIIFEPTLLVRYILFSIQ
jgi:hypothetical protein